MKLRSLAIVGGVVALLLAVACLLPRALVIGAPTADMVGQFIPWRAFAADSIRHGDWPLWNPHTFAGQPFLGGFQSGLFYPPNAVFVFLPLERALNFSVLVHLALLGFGVAAWARRRGHHPVAAAVAGFAAAGCGVVFPHVYAGHLSNLCTMAWVPWAFLGLEAWWRERRASGLLLASAAIALQILAGQLQYVFFFGVAAGVQALVVTAADPAARRRALPALALACVGAGALAAAQLLPGLEATREGVRQGALDYRFASAFALPPENLLTAIVPGFFGDTDGSAHRYWGRCYPWEMSVFFGLSSVVFLVAALREPEKSRAVRLDLAVAAGLLVLALGRHLPVYQLLYDHVPGFAQFRGMSKFTFPAVLFLLLGAAAGLDGLIRGRWGAKRAVFWIAGAAALVALAGTVVALQPERVERIAAWIRAHGSDDLIAPPEFSPGGASRAAAMVFLAAGTLGVLAGAVALRAWRPRWWWVAAAILPLEIVVFAARFWATTTVPAALPNEMRAFIAQHPGDYRVLNQLRPNSGFLLGAPDLWGNDPGVLRRYAEFMTFTQGGDPKAATQNVSFTSIHPLYRMLRLRYAFTLSPTGAQILEVNDPFPRALLVTDVRVAVGREAVFAALTAADFDARRTAVLEREPSPTPQPGGERGVVRVVRVENDALTLEVDAPAAALLLVTDLFSSGWRAHALPGSTQAVYEILPANYILRGIPLAAGKHAIRLEYRPATLTAGLVISAIAWAACLGGAWWLWRVRRKT